MPLLPLETNLFPEGLLASDHEPASGVWCVLHTRPRAEKALTRQLLSREIPFYLPLRHRKWISRGRTLSSHSPLFPGYVFLHGDEDSRRQALETNLVAYVLPVVDQIQLFEDLQRVQRLIESGAPLTLEEKLEPGTRVEISSGPLEGMQGTVLRKGKKLTFLVAVNFLRQGVSLEIDAQLIRPLER